MLYLSQTLEEKLSFNTNAHRNVFWVQFLFLQFHLLQNWTYSFCKDSHCLLEQTEFVQWQVYCFFTSEYFLQWASQKTARNQNIKGVFNSRVWDSTAGIVFDKTMFLTHIVMSKKNAQMHEIKWLGSLEKLNFVFCQYFWLN